LLKRLANDELSVLEGKQIISKIKKDMSSISFKMESVEQLNLRSELPLDFRQRIVKTLDFLC
jgi:fructose-1,6-bisphosphatase